MISQWFLHIMFTARAKVLFFLLLIGYVIGLFAYALSIFRTDDPVHQVKTVSAEMRKEYRDFSAKVRAGLFINNFPEFNFIKNLFVVDALIWFEYDQGELMLSTIEKFSFENSKNLIKSPPKIRNYGEKMLVTYNIKFDVKTDVNFHRFPLEDHRLSLVLINDSITAEEMYFDDNVHALSFKVGDDVFTSDWKIHSLSKIPGYEPLQFDEYNRGRVVNVPKVAFTIDFRKAGLNKILIILVPIFAAIFLSLFTFLMSFNSHQGKYTLSITSVTALLGYRFVIDQMSPVVGYFTIVDKLFIFFIGLCFFVFAFQVVMTRQYMFLLDRQTITATERSFTDIAILTPKKTEQIGTVVLYVLGIVLAVVVTIMVLW